MDQQFSIDLRAARRKAGLTQADCGHLLGGSVSIIKQLEDGKRLPTLTEICTFSILFGRSFEPLFGALMKQVREDLSDRLQTLRAPKDAHASTYNRKSTLDTLAERLAEEITRSNDM